MTKCVNIYRFKELTIYSFIMSVLLIVFEDKLFFVKYDNNTTFQDIIDESKTHIICKKIAIKYAKDNITDFTKKPSEISDLGIGPLYLYITDYLTDEFNNKPDMELSLVMNNTKEKMILACSHKDTVGKIKSIMLMQRGIPITNQELVLNDKKLENHKSLDDYNIRDESELIWINEGTNYIPTLDLTSKDDSLLNSSEKIQL